MNILLGGNKDSLSCLPRTLASAGRRACPLGCSAVGARPILVTSNLQFQANPNESANGSRLAQTLWGAREAHGTWMHIPGSKLTLRMRHWSH